MGFRDLLASSCWEPPSLLPGRTVGARKLHLFGRMLFLGSHEGMRFGLQLKNPRWGYRPHTWIMYNLMWCCWKIFGVVILYHITSPQSILVQLISVFSRLGDRIWPSVWTFLGSRHKLPDKLNHTCDFRQEPLALPWILVQCLSFEHLLWVRRILFCCIHRILINIDLSSWSRTCWSSTILIYLHLFAISNS